jgi:hypothetical protein
VRTVLVTSRPVHVEVTVRGGAGYDAGDHARTMVTQAIAFAHSPAREAQVLVDLHSGQATSGAVEVRAVVDVDGREVSAVAVASTLPVAMDVVDNRLRDELVRLGRRAQTARRVPRRAPARRQRDDASRR